MSQVSSLDELEREERSLSFLVDGLRALWQLMDDQKRPMLVCTGLLLVYQVVMLIVPYTLKRVFDELPRVVENGTDQKFVWLVSLLFIAPVVALGIKNFWQQPIFLRTVIILENRWPILAQRKLLALSQRYHEKENTGRKISKVSKGCDRLVDALLNIFWIMLPQIFFLLVTIGIVATLDWRIAVVFYLPFIPLTYAMKRVYDNAIPQWIEWEREKEMATGLLCQSIVNVATVQTFVQEKKEELNALAVRRRMEKTDLDIHLRFQPKFFWIGVGLNSAYLLAIVVGVMRAMQGQVSLGTLVFVLTTGNSSINFLYEIVMQYSRLLRNLVAAIRLKDLLDQPLDVCNNAPGVVPECYGGLFEFRDVSFAYDSGKEVVLTNFNLSVKPGEMVALIGRSGSGKSTAVKLLSRIYDPTSGAVLLDGTDIRTVDRDWYRRLFAVVKQGVEIFDASIRYNVSYGYPEATDAEVQEAVKAAHFEETFARFPKGLDTELGERGVRLSGGQAQRVGIARAYLALLRGAKVLIFDEATASLDTEKEREIQEMVTDMRRRVPDLSIVSIAHRLSTVHRSDKLCVIDNGRIIEQGDHSKLMERNGLYAYFIELQKIGELH
jgi:ATP-binding cassette subfamily B protein